MLKFGSVSAVRVYGISETQLGEVELSDLISTSAVTRGNIIKRMSFNTLLAAKRMNIY